MQLLILILYAGIQTPLTTRGATLPSNWGHNCNLNWKLWDKIHWIQWDVLEIQIFNYELFKKEISTTLHCKSFIIYSCAWLNILCFECPSWSEIDLVCKKILLYPHPQKLTGWLWTSNSPCLIYLTGFWLWEKYVRMLAGCHSWAPDWNESCKT